jgi:hypothetical protein
MARNKPDRNHASFRAEDEIDEVFAGANPNPDRTDCPGADELRSAGCKALPLDHPVYEHLAGCSPCYQQFRGYQKPIRRASRFRPALLAAAAVLIAVVGVGYIGRNLGIGPWNSLPATAAAQPLFIDYRAVSTTRSEAGDPARPPLPLPRANLDATILLPVGSEPGQYELRLVDGNRQVRLDNQASAQLKDFAVRIEINLDLRSFAPGSYSLEIRRLGEDWDPHPVVIR